MRNNYKDDAAGQTRMELSIINAAVWWGFPVTCFIVLQQTVCPAILVG
jgi:hypothetical protein